MNFPVLRAFPKSGWRMRTVNRILENTLNLYNGRIQDISIRKDLDRENTQTQT